jgi:ribulose-phosphate 3-epimerase
MDGHFVPNITIGPCVIKDLRKTSELPFDVHLMIENPDNYIEDFANSGADIITVHQEACIHLDRTIQFIKSLGKKAGVSLVPTTPPEVLDYILPELDLILVMSVNPGFGGQSFLESQLEKIEILRQKIDATGKKIDLEVDGGINAETAPLVVNAGADVLVAGSATFKGGKDKYKENMDSLRV